MNTSIGIFTRGYRHSWKYCSWCSFGEIKFDLTLKIQISSISCCLLFNLGKNVCSTINKNNVKTWFFIRNFNALYLQSDTYLVSIILRDFVKQNQTLESGFSSNFVWGTSLWFPALWWLLEPKILISHTVINDWLDFHVVKYLWKYIQLLIWKSMSNFMLRSFCFQYTISSPMRLRSKINWGENSVEAFARENLELDMRWSSTTNRFFGALAHFSWLRFIELCSDWSNRYFLCFLEVLQSQIFHLPSLNVGPFRHIYERCSTYNGTNSKR